MSLFEVAVLGAHVQLAPGETLLKACLRQGVNVPFSCGGGTCHACLMKCVAGEVPVAAQRGVAEELAAKGYFLPCICLPESNMQVVLPDVRDFVVDATLAEAASDAFGWNLQFELWRDLPGLARDTRVEIELADGGSFQGVVTALPADAYYLAVRVAPAGDWQALLGQALKLRRVALDENIPALEALDLHPEPDPALWESLGATRVRRIMETFYAQVFADERLAPFFAGVTPERVIGKQYSFMQKLTTGEKVYFGDNPRNAHHWMVISEDLFEHRESLMRNALLAHGANEDEIARWMRLESFYRHDILKNRAFPRIIDGKAQPLDGYDEEILTVGSVCDHCGNAVEAGEKVRFHRRLGTISCKRCSN